jgi:hypothetical protein
MFGKQWCKGSCSLAQQWPHHQNVFHLCLQKLPVYTFVSCFIVRRKKYFPLSSNCIESNVHLDFLSCRNVGSVIDMIQYFLSMSPLSVSSRSFFFSRRENCLRFSPRDNPVHKITKLSDKTLRVTMNSNKIWQVSWNNFERLCNDASDFVRNRTKSKMRTHASDFGADHRCYLSTLQQAIPSQAGRWHFGTQLCDAEAPKKCRRYAEETSLIAAVKLWTWCGPLSENICCKSWCEKRVKYCRTPYDNQSCV